MKFYPIEAFILFSIAASASSSPVASRDVTIAGASIVLTSDNNKQPLITARALGTPSSQSFTLAAINRLKQTPYPSSKLYIVRATNMKSSYTKRKSLIDDPILA